MGRRSEDVRQVGPDVAAPVAVEIDRVAGEGRGHELKLAHGAGPRALHVCRSDMALVEDAQGIDQLGAEERAAPFVVGQRRQRPDHGIAPGVPAEVALQPPEGDQVARLDVIFAPDSLQKRPMLGQHPAAALDALRGHGPVQVGPKGPGELGLLAVQLEHPLDRRDPGQRGLDGRLGDAGRGGVPLDPLEPCVEGGQLRDGSRDRRTGQGEPGHGDGRQASQPNRQSCHWMVSARGRSPRLAPAGQTLVPQGPRAAQSALARITPFQGLRPGGKLCHGAR